MAGSFKSIEIRSKSKEKKIMYDFLVNPVKFIIKTLAVQFGTFATLKAAKAAKIWYFRYEWQIWLDFSEQPVGH